MNKVYTATMEILDEMNFSIKHKGYMYITNSVNIVVSNPFAINNIRGGVYKKIAEKYETTVACVDRLMRYSIEQAVQNASDECILKYFGDELGDDVSIVVSKISNPTIFITGIQKYLKRNSA